MSYVHVVFTLPHTLHFLCRRNAALLYHLLFRASAATLLEVTADPRHLGAAIGFLSILAPRAERISYGPRRVPTDSDIDVVRKADYTESSAEYGDILGDSR